MPSRTGNGLAGPRPRPCVLPRFRNCTARASANPKPHAGFRSAHLHPTNPGSKIMKRPKRDPERENRIHNEAIADAGPEEQAMSWY